MKSLRADSRQYLHVVTNRIAKRLGESLGLEPELVTVMSADELHGIVTKNRPIPDDLQERHRHSVQIPKPGDTYETVVEKDAVDFVSRAIRHENVSGSDTVQGRTAYQGCVSGTVRLVFGPQHNDKVKAGDILVSTATSPQLLPAMFRAAAFVTDVGGITSHAAIVARELKKPCVVGTKYATQVLRDGQRVTVDADNGIIKIIG